jgi:hypothetical protein
MKKSIATISQPFVEKYLDKNRYAEGSLLRADKIDKQSECITKFLIYIVANSFLAYLMADVNFNHWTLGGKYERLELFDDYPCPSVPDYLNEFYLFKLGYFTHEFIFATLYHRHRPDFKEMVIHHIVTVVLTFFSYSTN